jgi:hypothetical protein
MLRWVGAPQKKTHGKKKNLSLSEKKKTESKIYQETHISRSLKDCERRSMQLAVQKKKRRHVGRDPQRK